jgi:hypothetical protein
MFQVFQDEKKIEGSHEFSPSVSENGARFAKIEYIFC